MVLAGITLSKEQVRRGSELAAEQGVPNAHFQVRTCSAVIRSKMEVLLTKQRL